MGAEEKTQSAKTGNRLVYSVEAAVLHSIEDSSLIDGIDQDWDVLTSHARLLPGDTYSLLKPSRYSIKMKLWCQRTTYECYSIGYGRRNAVRPHKDCCAWK